MKVVSFLDEKEIIKTMITKRTLIPILGSGFSKGCKSLHGRVPSGSEMKQYMKDSLRSKTQDDLSLKSFSDIYGYYSKLVDSAQRKQYWIDFFTKVCLSDERKGFLSGPWPYIYSLNVDDAIEKNSDYIIVGPNTEFDENILESNKIVFKMHGDVQQIIYAKYPENLYVFDRTQYLKSFENNKWILNKLKEDYIDKNLLFLGCSLDDELDFEYIAACVDTYYNNFPALQTKKYFVTTHRPSETDIIDLEKCGINVVVLIEDYFKFYSSFLGILEEINAIPIDALDSYKNIKTKYITDKTKNKDFILHAKQIFNIENRTIEIPDFFIRRNLSANIIQDFISVHRIHIVYGKRISGKTYLLASLVSQIKDRTTYYFESRSSLNKQTIDLLLHKKNSCVFIDTNVISDDDLGYLLANDPKILEKNALDFVICINTSKKEIVYEVAKYKQHAHVSLFYLDNQLEMNEFNSLKRKLTSLNLPYFEKDLTILDNLINLQKKLDTRGCFPQYSDICFTHNNYMYFVFLLLLAHKGKITSTDMVTFNIDREPYELSPKLSEVYESDYRDLLLNNSLNNSYWQIVCNATVWLLGYLSFISTNQLYFESIVKSIIFIVNKIKSDTRRSKNELFDFLRFDNLNMILGGSRKRIIQEAYSRLKTVLHDDYQFNHQHAKCLLWGIEKEKDKKEQTNLLDESLRSALISQQQIEEQLKNKKRNESLYISSAHINFTLSMIRVKKYYFNQTTTTFRSAIEQLFITLRYDENKNAEELFDAKTDDYSDYSVSKFLDDLLLQKFDYGNDVKLRDKINYVINFRLRH